MPCGMVLAVLWDLVSLPVVVSVKGPRGYHVGAFVTSLSWLSHLVLTRCVGVLVRGAFRYGWL